MKRTRKNHIGNIAALVLAFAAILLVALVARGLVPTAIDDTSGEISEERIAESVLKILETKIEAGII